MKNKRLSIKAMGMVLGVLVVSSSIAEADLLPTYQDLLESRVRNDPLYYDHVDQFCRGKNLGDRCKITGSALEGGGDGVCKRNIDGWGKRVIAQCEREFTPEVSRKTPESAYQLNEFVCLMMKATPADSFKDAKTGKQLSCGSVPMVSDQFCHELKAGDLCTAEVIVNGTRFDNSGVCVLQTQKVVSYAIDIAHKHEKFHFKQQELTRPLLSCLASTPVTQVIEQGKNPRKVYWFESLFR